jgi:hypothetical protein
MRHSSSRVHRDYLKEHDMSRDSSRLARSGKTRTRKAYDSIEARAMAAVGRNTVKRTVKRAKRLASKAAIPAALIAGGLVMTGVVVAKIRRRRMPA